MGLPPEKISTFFSSVNERDVDIWTVMSDDEPRKSAP
jgi:hypothetical protein